MPAKVKILVEGHTSAGSLAENGVEKTQPTVTLVQDGDVIMVVDPGILESQQVLIDALAEEDLTVDDVNFVCITHSHIDHFRNMGMFPDAKILEYYGLWDKNTVDEWSENFTENIRVLHTPGHDYSGVSLFVKTKEGVVAICGDVFWKENYPATASDDAFASNPGRLEESRETVLKMADWIIPGHGPMYKNNKTPAPASAKEGKPAEKVNHVKITVACKKCGRRMEQKDKCLCSPFLCFNCCACGFDCPVCGCSHKRNR